jgi:hypothetical protein
MSNDCTEAADEFEDCPELDCVSLSMEFFEIPITSGADKEIKGIPAIHRGIL